MGERRGVQDGVARVDVVDVGVVAVAGEQQVAVGEHRRPWAGRWCRWCRTARPRRCGSAGARVDGVAAEQRAMVGGAGGDDRRQRRRHAAARQSVGELRAGEAQPASPSRPGSRPSPWRAACCSWARRRGRRARCRRAAGSIPGSSPSPAPRASPRLQPVPREQRAGDALHLRLERAVAELPPSHGDRRPVRMDPGQLCSVSERFMRGAGSGSIAHALRAGAVLRWPVARCPPAQRPVACADAGVAR